MNVKIVILKSKTHKINIGVIKKIEKIEYNCKYCDYKTKNKKHFDRHNEGPRHKYKKDYIEGNIKDKKCNKCKEIKLLECFGKDQNTIDKHSRYCKDCVSNRKKEYYEKNKDEIKNINNMRSRLRNYLSHNNIDKNNDTFETIGISKELFQKWIKFNLKIDKLEDKDYHLDHLQPLASYNCKTYEDVIETECNHWTNIIPTTPEYNLKKGSREPSLKEKIKQDIRICIFKIRNGIKK